MKDTYLEFLHTRFSVRPPIVATKSINIHAAPTIGQNKSTKAALPILHRRLCFCVLLGSGLFSNPFGWPLAHAQETEAPQIKALKNKANKLNSSEEQLPQVALSKELLFKILSSDLAIQRGEWGSAYVTLMRAAKDTADPRLAKKAAEVAMGAQQLAEALEAVNFWRSLSPQSFEAGQYYLSLMVVKSDFAEIEKFYLEQLNKVKAEERGALLYQAQSLLARMQDKKRAFLCLENIAAGTTSFDSHIILARGAFASGDQARALKEAQQALALQADSELAFLTLLQVSGQADSKPLAAEFIKRYPQALEVHLAYVSILIESRQLEMARKELVSLLAKYEAAKKPQSRLLMSLGSIELELQHSDAAATYFLRFLAQAEEDEDKNQAYINLAQTELQKKNLKAADAWLAKVDNNEAKNATWFNVQMRRALLMASDQRFGEARQFLQRVKINSDAEEALILQTEAQVMKAAGQQTEAFVLLEAALGNFPRHPDLLYDYAMLAENFKRYEEMEAALKQLITVAPNNAFAYNALGYSYADRNIQLDQADQLLKRALELAPEDPYILDSFAWLKYRQGDLNQAEQILRRCLSLRQDPEIEVHLAEVLWAQNKRDEARQLFKTAGKKDPDNELLRSTVMRLGIALP